MSSLSCISSYTFSKPVWYVANLDRPLLVPLSVFKTAPPDSVTCAAGIATDLTIPELETSDSTADRITDSLNTFFMSSKSLPSASSIAFASLSSVNDELFSDFFILIRESVVASDTPLMAPILPSVLSFIHLPIPCDIILFLVTSLPLAPLPTISDVILSISICLYSSTTLLVSAPLPGLIFFRS